MNRKMIEIVNIFDIFEAWRFGTNTRLLFCRLL